MLSTYCQHCGSKHEYRMTKPNFCSSCGQPLAGDFEQARATIKPEPPTRKTAHHEIHDEDGTDIYELPDISKLEYDIEVSNNSNFTLGSIMPRQDTREVAPQQKKKRGRPKKNG